MRKYRIYLLTVILIGGLALTGCGDNDTPSNGDQEAQRDEISQQNESNEPTETTNNGTRVDPTAQLEEIRGQILSFNEQGAQLEVIIASESSDGGEVEVTGSEDNETINVFFTEDTGFELIVERFISNVESERLEERVASIDDLESNPLPFLHVTGEFQGYDFIVHHAVIWRTVE